MDIQPFQRRTYLLVVPFCALILMVGWHEEHPAHEKPVQLIPRLFSSTGGGRIPEGEWTIPGSPGKTASKQK